MIPKQKREKTRLRWSEIKHYFTCPNKYDLSTKFEPEFKDATLKLFMHGNWFEAFLMRDKNGVLENGGLKNGGKSVDYHRIEAAAKKVQSMVTLENCQDDDHSFIKLNRDHGDHVRTGEIDFRGRVISPEHGIDGRFLTDIKLTGSLDWIWFGQKKKVDVMQVVWYSYLNFLNTGEMLDGLYMICEYQKDQDPIVRMLPVNVTKASYEYLEMAVTEILLDLIRAPKPNTQNCLGWRNKAGRCPYLMGCPQGKEILSIAEPIDFDSLMQ